jgi:hypothetical protein
MPYRPRGGSASGRGQSLRFGCISAHAWLRRLSISGFVRIAQQRSNREGGITGDGVVAEETRHGRTF